MDVSDEGQVEAGMTRVIEAFGRLDILISNAGIQTVAPIVEFDFAKWRHLLAIHLDGAFLTTRAALRQAQALGISEDDVVRNVMLKETVDGEFTTVADVAAFAVFLAGFPSNALTGQSVVVSHGWFMQ